MQAIAMLLSLLSCPYRPFVAHNFRLGNQAKNGENKLQLRFLVAELTSAKAYLWQNNCF
jgi:hypothetical protein